MKRDGTYGLFGAGAGGFCRRVGGGHGGLLGDLVGGGHCVVIGRGLYRRMEAVVVQAMRIKLADGGISRRSEGRAGQTALRERAAASSL